VRAARAHAGAGGDGLGDDAVDVGQLPFVDQRPERGRPGLHEFTETHVMAVPSDG
jgi:hypothetical protein